MIRTLSLFTLAFGALLLVGCGGGETEGGQSADKKITLAYVEWASEVASTNVVAAILEDRYGYEVDKKAVGAGIMWRAIATGDADAMVAAWLPTTHEKYLADVADQVDDLGPNLDGTRIGLVVPDYVTIDSITELDAHADQFAGKIYGIDSGAGIMQTTEQAIEEYPIEKLDLLDSSDAAMTQMLANKYEEQEWIVVTGWTPHWMFAAYDLKYLDDPENLYGGAEQIHTIVRAGLNEDHPEVHAFLDRFSWEPADMEQVMVWNEEGGADPAANARRWITENPEKVKAWLGE